MEKSILPTAREDSFLPRFWKPDLLHSVTEIHEKHQRLETLKEKNSNSTELKALTLITERLTEDACQMVSIIYVQTPEHIAG